MVLADLLVLWDKNKNPFVSFWHFNGERRVWVEGKDCKILHDPGKIMMGFLSATKMMGSVLNVEKDKILRQLC